MLKIVKCGSEFTIPRKSVVKIDTTYDGVLVTLCDNTEIRYTLSVSPQIKAVMPIIRSTTADIVVLNLDAALSGQYDKVITLEMKPKVQPQVVVIQQNPVKDTVETPKKKGGRPKGSTTKKVTSKGK